jgi:hypothetical protein
LGIAPFLRWQINFNDRSDDSFGETYCSFHQIVEQNDGGVRGEIIKTKHQAMSLAARELDVSAFALHGEGPSDPVPGRPVKCGLSLATRSAFWSRRRRPHLAHWLDRQLLEGPAA